MFKDKLYGFKCFTFKGNHSIPAGCNILVSVYGMHRNEKYFEDPLAFKPERFFADESDLRHPFSYIPFSAGPRNCIGTCFSLRGNGTVPQQK